MLQGYVNDQLSNTSSGTPLFLTNGDSKAFDDVVAMNVYGDYVTIQKEDCINHVAKKNGTAICNLADSMKATKQSISGKEKSTKEKIGKIQNLYGRAIKEYSSDVDLLQKRIMGIHLHLSSIDNSSLGVCGKGL